MVATLRELALLVALGLNTVHARSGTRCRSTHGDPTLFLQRLVVALSLAMLLSVGRDSPLPTSELSGTPESANTSLVASAAGEAQGSDARLSQSLAAGAGVFLSRVATVAPGRAVRAPWEATHTAHRFEALELPRIRETQRVRLLFGAVLVASQSGRLSVHAQQLPPPVRA